MRIVPIVLSFAALLVPVLAAQDEEPEPTPHERARAHYAAGEYQEAIDVLRPFLETEPDAARSWMLLGSCHHGLAQYERALEIHAKVASFEDHRSSGCYNMACAYAMLGEVDLAFEWLTKAREAGFGDLNLLRTDPELDTLRDDERFAAFLSLEGLPASFREPGVDVLRVIEGEAAGDQFGWIGRNAGDCDGDGTADLLISAPFKQIEGPNAGRIYVDSGRTGERLFTASGRPGEYLGIGIDSAGDVDGDGHADVIAGASGSKETGRAYVYSGRSGELLRTLAGENPGDQFGRKVAGTGDVDGDGRPDVIVGAPGFDGVHEEAGRAYVFSGRTGETILTLDGERAGDHFGSAVDGCTGPEGRLLIVGAHDAGEGQRGRVYVYRHADGAAEPAFVIESGPDDVNLGRMFVSAVGDVDGDGHVDVYGSDWESNAHGLSGSGRIYIHSGRDGTRLHELSGSRPTDGFGIGTCEAGDVDGDGADDFLVGAWQSNAGAPAGGRCTLFSGRTGEILATYSCEAPSDTFGFDTTGMGDLNGDGRLDFLVTAAYSHVNGPRSGRVFVISAPELD